jgi:hypothetical protein
VVEITLKPGGFWKRFSFRVRAEGPIADAIDEKPGRAFGEKLSRRSHPGSPLLRGRDGSFFMRMGHKAGLER